MEEAKGGAEVGGVAVGIGGGVGLEKQEKVGLGAGDVEGRIGGGAEGGAVVGGGSVGKGRGTEGREGLGREGGEAGRAVR